MMYYMPFTHLPEALIAPITALTGPLTILLPSLKLASAPMQAAAGQGLLKLASPEKVDPERLADAVRAFTQWADLHKGRAGELTGMFQAGQISGGQESSAHQIRSMINRYGSDADQAWDASAFQAALFLALAHSYDQQQEALDNDLGSFQALERQFGQILGEGGDQEVALGAMALPAGTDAADGGRGPYMAEQRVAAWARLAAPHLSTARALVTTSVQVWDHLMALLPDAQPIWDGRLTIPVGDGPGSGHPVQTLFDTLATAEAPRKVALDQLAALAVEDGALRLSVAVVSGQTPSALIETFILENHPEGRKAAAGAGMRNTLVVRFGLVGRPARSMAV